MPDCFCDPDVWGPDGLECGNGHNPVCPNADRPQFTHWEPAWGGAIRRFPIGNVPDMTRGFRVVRFEVDPEGRETILEWEPAGGD